MTISTTTPTTTTPGQHFEYIRDYLGEVREALARGDRLTALRFLAEIEGHARHLSRQAGTSHSPARR